MTTAKERKQKKKKTISQFTIISSRHTLYNRNKRPVKRNRKYLDDLCLNENTHENTHENTKQLVTTIIETKNYSKSKPKEKWGKKVICFVVVVVFFFFFCWAVSWRAYTSSSRIHWTFIMHEWIGSDRIGSDRSNGYTTSFINFRFCCCHFVFHSVFSNRINRLAIDDHWSLQHCIASTVTFIVATNDEHSFDTLFVYFGLFFSLLFIFCVVFLLLFGRFWNWTRIAAW